MARYVFVARNNRGNTVIYNESSYDEDMMDKECEGNGYLEFWRRCMEDVAYIIDGKNEWHGEIEDLYLGEVVKSW